jgi:hypothetical protein
MRVTLIIAILLAGSAFATEFSMSYSVRDAYVQPNPLDNEIRGSISVIVNDTLDFGGTIIREQQNGESQTGIDYHGFVMGRLWKAGIEITDPAAADWYRGTLIAGVRYPYRDVRLGVSAVRQYSKKFLSDGVWMGRVDIAYDSQVSERVSARAKAFYDYGKDRRSAEVYVGARYAITQHLGITPFYLYSGIKRSGTWEAQRQGKIEISLSV